MFFPRYTHNDTDDWVLPKGVSLKRDSHLLAPRSVRIYDVEMDTFEDISIEEYNHRCFNKILGEEILKEINREIIEKINVAAKRF